MAGPTDWTTLTDITDQVDRRTTRAPALIRFRGVLYLFFRGASDEGTIYCCLSSDGSRWSDLVNLSDVPHGPRAATGVVPIVFRDELYVFFRSHEKKTDVHVIRTADGSTWQPPVSIFADNQGQTSMAPAPVVFDNRLYVLYRGESQPDHVYAVASPDGRKWRAQLKITDETGVKIRSGTVPVPIVFGEHTMLILCCRYDQHLVAARLDRTGTWDTIDITDECGARPVQDPVPVIFNGTLRLYFRGKFNEKTVFERVRTDDCVTWHSSSGGGLHDADTKEPVTPVVHEDRLYVFFRGESNNHHVNVFVDDDKIGHYTPISSQNKASTDGMVQAVSTDNGIVVAFRSTKYDNQGLAAFSQAGARPWAPRLLSARAAFAAVHENGTREQCATKGVLDDHAQNMVAYRDWFLFTCDRTGQHADHLYIVDRDGLAAPRAMDFGVDDFDRAEGCQVIGDYLAVALSNGTEGRVVFYDLSVLTALEPPRLLPGPSVALPAIATAVGITDLGLGTRRRYALAAFIDRQVFLYTSTNTPLGNPLCRFQPDYSLGVTQLPPEGMHLLTDQVGEAFMLLMTTEGDDPTNPPDRARLYGLTQGTAWARRLAERSFRTTASTIHFAWGAGTHLTSPTSVSFYAGSRNPDASLPYDVFR